MIKTMMRPMMLIVAIGLASPRLAGAQTVADVLTFLVTNQSVQTGSVDRDRDAARATAVGLADLVVRTKYTLYDEDGAGIATKVDVRLPTGRQEDLLGAGSTSLKFSAIGSIERGRTSGHANAGISLGGLAREVSDGGALALAATGRVTVTGELLGRWLDSSGHITRFVAPHPRLTGVQTIRLTPDASTLHIITLVPGVKWNVSDTWVLAANVSVPLTSGGLTSRFTPFVGLDYARSR